MVLTALTPCRRLEKPREEPPEGSFTPAPPVLASATPSAPYRRETLRPWDALYTAGSGVMSPTSCIHTLTRAAISRTRSR